MSSFVDSGGVSVTILSSSAVSFPFVMRFEHAVSGRCEALLSTSSRPFASVLLSLGSLSLSCKNNFSLNSLSKVDALLSSAMLSRANFSRVEGAVVWGSERLVTGSVDFKLAPISRQSSSLDGSVLESGFPTTKYCNEVNNVNNLVARAKYP